MVASGVYTLKGSQECKKQKYIFRRGLPDVSIVGLFVRGSTSITTTISRNACERVMSWPSDRFFSRMIGLSKILKNNQKFTLFYQCICWDFYRFLQTVLISYIAIIRFMSDLNDLRGKDVIVVRSLPLHYYKYMQFCDYKYISHHLKNHREIHSLFTLIFSFDF